MSDNGDCQGGDERFVVRCRGLVSLLLRLIKILKSSLINFRPLDSSTRNKAGIYVCYDALSLAKVVSFKYHVAKEAQPSNQFGSLATITPSMKEELVCTNGFFVCFSLGPALKTSWWNFSPPLKSTQKIFT